MIWTFVLIAWVALIVIGLLVVRTGSRADRSIYRKQLGRELDA